MLEWHKGVDCMSENMTLDIDVDSIVAYGHTPRPETLAFIERIESGEEELVGPFSSKEELWKSLGI